MGELIKRALAWAIGMAFGRIVAAFGISVITYNSLNGYLHDYLNQFVATLQGVPSAALNILLMSGISDAVGIIGSAALARMLVVTAAGAVGVKTSA